MWHIIEHRSLELLDTEGFINRYYEHTRISTTYVNAYECTEAEYERAFLRRKYSSYDSFRQVLNGRRDRDVIISI